MATLDIFKQDAFSLVEMLPSVENLDWQPQRLGQLGIFTPYPVRTKTVSIESRDGVLSLIKTTPRGAPLAQRTTEKRNIRNFSTVRIAKGDRITADELADIRAFGTETETMQVQAEIARRMSGPMGLMNEIEMTLENMRMGCIQGVVKDSDGSTLVDWYNEWNVTLSPTAEHGFNLAAANNGAVRETCAKVIRAMMVNSKGAWGAGTRVHALCDNTFWDALIKNEEVRQTYLNYQAAADLRSNATGWYNTFEFGGITWENYRGTDDGTTVVIPAGKARFIPVNAPGAFLEIFSPGETFEYINQPGKKVYPMIVTDTQRNMYADIEVYSYPLHVCTRPLMLQSARIGA